MNIKKTNIKTETYTVSPNFLVDVQTNTEDETFTNFFLYHKRYSIKEMIVGLNVKILKEAWEYTTIEEVIEHLINEEDLYNYYKEYIKNGFVFEEDARIEIREDFDISDYEDELEEREER